MLQNNRVALVTGSSRGIGEEIIRKLSESDMDVVITYHSNKQQATHLLDTIKKNNRNGLLVQLDLRDESSILRAFEEIEKYYGKLDILVNNAGIGVPQPIEQLTLEEWNHTLTINLTGAFLCTKYAIPLLKKSEEGRIINISSVAALTGGSFGPHYGASKAGLIGLTKSSARELAKYNISVNVIAPGPIASEMTDSLNDAVMEGIIGNTPLGRLGKKSEVAELVLQLANPKIGYLTGQTIVMDGGRYMQ
ncbi:3-oxoacyl-ACP reductase FabG [Paenibacillus polymyxa]|nr:3-oxoacyl-ACP reductase FabG [Paenibacillus polymyxa]